MTKIAEMTQEMKDKLIAAGRQDLVEIWEFQKEGYAGILSNGTIVDRRKFPDAIPMQCNALFSIPDPKPVDKPKTK